MKRTNWLAGLLVGVVGAILFWIIPTLGVAVLALFALVAVTRRDGSYGVSGLLVGGGGTSLAVLSRAIASCDDFNKLPNQECGMPDLTAWIVLGAGLLLAGIALLVVALRRRR